MLHLEKKLKKMKKTLYIVKKACYNKHINQGEKVWID